MPLSRQETHKHVSHVCKAVEQGASSAIASRLRIPVASDGVASGR